MYCNFSSDLYAPCAFLITNLSAENRKKESLILSGIRIAQSNREGNSYCCFGYEIHIQCLLETSLKTWYFREVSVIDLI